VSGPGGPHFSGLGEAASWIVEKIDSSKAIELVTTDVLGMVLPRTGIEYGKRGPDAGRETLIRELAGTVFNVFLIGWIGSALLKVYNNRSASMNPLGLHTGAWINAKALKAFSQVFQDALKEAKTPAEAREKFVEKMLRSFRATDGHLLPEAAQMLKQVDATLATEVDKILAAGAKDGKLSDQAVNALKKLFQHSDNAAIGTTHLEAMAQQFERTLRTDPVHVGRYSEEEIAKKVAQFRLTQSASLVGSTQEKALLDAMVRTASETGKLSEEVILKTLDAQGQEKTLLGARNLRTTLQEMKYFLEQYIDRAMGSPAADAALKTRSKTAVDSWRELVTKELMGPGETNFLGKIGRYLPFFGTPAKEMGLIPYTYRSRWFLTLLPLVLTIGVSVSVSYLNNWLTQRKHGGKVFFPGEGMPPPGETKGPQGPSNPSFHSGGVHGSQLARSGSAFEAFQRQRAATAGRLA
jgi:hypothetical protein